MTLIIALAFGVLGAILGSFIGVVAERVYTGQSWKSGRSRCNSCRRELAAQDMVPVLSWLLHRGRCRQCGSRVPGVYAIYELSLGIMFAHAYLQFGLTLQLAVFLVVLLVIAFIVIYDLRHMLVPITASSLLVLVSAVYALVALPNGTAILHAVLWAIGISLFFYCLYAFSRGRAMGLGDTPVGFALALLAAPYALSGLFFSFWIGAVIGILILVLRRGGPTMGIEVPFVPFMALGFLLAIFIQWNPLPF